MEKEPTRETAPKQYRLIFRPNARTEEMHFESIDEIPQKLAELDSDGDEDEVWSGDLDELLAGGIWDELKVPPGDDDMIELQEQDGDDWLFVGAYSTEEDLADSVMKMKSVPTTEDGETIH